jgi:hypothetical protein
MANEYRKINMIHYTQQDYMKLIEILHSDVGEQNEEQAQCTPHKDSFWEPNRRYYRITFKVKGRTVSMKKSNLPLLLFSKKIMYKMNIPNMNIALSGSCSNFTKRMVITEIRYITNNLITFLCRIPLTKVPLYINSFPELSRWRMSINK